MAIPGGIKRIPVFAAASPTVQVGWLLFALSALSLALVGIAPFHQLLQTACTSAVCLNGQLTPAEVLVAFEFGDSLPEYADLAVIIYHFTSLLLFFTAVLLIWRKPAHGAAVSGAFCLTALATRDLAQAAAQLAPTLMIPAQIIYFVQLAVLLPLFCLIPDGRFQPSWFRWPALLAGFAAALIAFGMVGAQAGNLLGLIIGVMIVGSVVYRYRLLAATPAQENVAWTLAAVALLAGVQLIGRPVRPLPLSAISLEQVPATAFGFFPVIGMLLLVGGLTSLTVALLNDALFQVEVVLNRALVYSLLTLFVVGGYVLVVGYLSLLFQGSGSVWFSLIATGMVAVCFQPIRQRVQRFVNRLLYGERDDPYYVVTHLGQRLAAAFDPSTIPATIAETVRKSLQLPYVAIEIGHENEAETIAASGTPVADPLRFPLAYQGITIGHLCVEARRGDAALAAADRALLIDLAQQAGVAIHAVRLMADLQRLTADLQRSRERLVLAREEERRRLRRDLHDDLAPTLAGLALRAGTIGELARSDPLKAGELADHLDLAIRNAVGTIRRLVYDLRPPALDDLGLLPAIQERAAQWSGDPGSATRLQVTVAAPDSLPALPAAVEVAAYRIVQEALMNVVKHAQARTCQIRIVATDTLTIDIADDGVGMPDDPGWGIGLRSMEERATELGGTCQIARRSARGTRVHVCLPLVREVSR